MSKAFDKVWHEGLIFKLKSYGIEGNLLALLRDFLSDRQQRVVINGKFSVWKNISAGVPQGSVLGPLLFLIYINDLPDSLQTKPYLFADDVSLFESVHNESESADKLNDDLSVINYWSYQWKMLFNPDANKQAIEVYFTNKNMIDNIPRLLFNGNFVNSLHFHKHLGLILDHKLTFVNHLNGKIAQANKGIGVIKALYFILPRKALLDIYKSFIRPHLDYCDIIYHKPTSDELSILDYDINSSINPNKTFNDMIESVQYNAALAITGCIRGTSRDRIYNELGIMSLYDRRNFRRLVFLYKIKNDLLPNYLKLLLPENQVPNNYSFRRRHRNIISTRTKKFQYSFFPHCVNAWGKLSNFITGALTLSIFKSRYLQFFSVAPNSIFKIHNPDGLKFLTRLRMGLSHLKSHKYRHNFKDTPDQFCVCDNKSIESVEHYLLCCPLYCPMREQLFTDLNNEISIIPFHKTFLTRLLLYGNESFSAYTNNFILKCSINYIMNTERFHGPLL